MTMRKMRKLLVICLIAALCFVLNGATSVSNSEYIALSDLCCEKLDIPAIEYVYPQNTSRISGRIDSDISALSVVTVNDSFTLLSK